MGNFNEKTDKNENLKNFTGMHSLHKESNNNGIRLVDFAVQSYMISRNDIFKHLNAHKVSRDHLMKEY